MNLFNKQKQEYINFDFSKVLNTEKVFVKKVNKTKLNTLFDELIIRVEQGIDITVHLDFALDTMSEYEIMFFTEMCWTAFMDMRKQIISSAIYTGLRPTWENIIYLYSIAVASLRYDVEIYPEVKECMKDSLVNTHKLSAASVAFTWFVVYMAGRYAKPQYVNLFNRYKECSKDSGLFHD